MAIPEKSNNTQGSIHRGTDQIHQYFEHCFALFSDISQGQLEMEIHEIITCDKHQSWAVKPLGGNHGTMGVETINLLHGLWRCDIKILRRTISSVLILFNTETNGFKDESSHFLEPCFRE